MAPKKIAALGQFYARSSMYFEIYTKVLTASELLYIINSSYYRYIDSNPEMSNESHDSSPFPYEPNGSQQIIFNFDKLFKAAAKSYKAEFLQKAEKVAEEKFGFELKKSVEDPRYGKNDSGDSLSEKSQLILID